MRQRSTVHGLEPPAPNAKPSPEPTLEQKLEQSLDDKKRQAAGLRGRYRAPQPGGNEAAQTALNIAAAEAKPPEPKAPPPVQPSPLESAAPEPSPPTIDLPRGTLDLAPEAERIVTSIFDGPDPFEEQQELREWLRQRDRFSALSHGQREDLLGRAADMVQRGAEMQAQFRVMSDEFERQADLTMAAMHESAVASLLSENERLKEEGKPIKRINKDDVKSTIATAFPDEWFDLERRRSRVKHAVRVVESLVDQLNARQRDLRAMVERSKAE